MIARPKKTKTGRGLRYPWDQWFARRSLTLVRGVHFTCELTSMDCQIRTAAFHRRKRVSVRRVYRPYRNQYVEALEVEISDA